MTVRIFYADVPQDVVRLNVMQNPLLRVCNDIFCAKSWIADQSCYFLDIIYLKLICYWTLINILKFNIPNTFFDSVARRSVASAIGSDTKNRATKWLRSATSGQLQISTVLTVYNNNVILLMIFHAHIRLMTNTLLKMVYLNLHIVYRFGIRSLNKQTDKKIKNTDTFVSKNTIYKVDVLNFREKIYFYFFYYFCSLFF